MVPFLICEFKKEALSNLVKECFGSDFPDIFNKQQIDYIFRYLSDFIKKPEPGEREESSVLLEFEYIDRDYLDDYAKFYARQFSNRGHKCARMHFFSKALQHDQIDNVLKGGQDSDFIKTLQDNYLGFMVIKPLPRNFIGKTCLRVYPQIYNDDHSNDRKVILKREYAVSLFGIDLKVTSIGFQEQDKVVSACATTAIWSALHAMNWVAPHDIPSHSQITTDAINFIPGSSNSFPNKGLSTKQILRAFDVLGFRHQSINIKGIEHASLSSIVKSYVASGYPVLLMGQIFCNEGEKGEKEEWQLLGAHAVTVLGYKLISNDPLSQVDALYLHDDRFGPFARAHLRIPEEAQGGNVSSETQRQLGEPPEPSPERNSQPCVLELQQKDGAQWKPPHEVFVPQVLIVATPRNVRVPLSAVEAIGYTFPKTWTNIFREPEGVAPTDHGTSRAPTFSYRLVQINELKRNFRQDSQWLMIDGRPLSTKEDPEAEARRRLKFLTQSFARFQWVVTASFEGRELFKILVDATDVPQGDAVSAVLYRREAADILDALRHQLTDRSQMDEEMLAVPFCSSFVKRLKLATDGLGEHLDRTYGELRAPRYIKKSEFDGDELVQNTSRQTFYDPVGKTIDELFPNSSQGPLIWIINEEGALIIGYEITKVGQPEEKIGHPGLTGSRPARIAGELSKKEDGSGWYVNDKSGRYSGEYSNIKGLLNNAVERFNAYFNDKFEANPINR